MTVVAKRESTYLTRPITKLLHYVLGMPVLLRQDGGHLVRHIYPLQQLIDPLSDGVLTLRVIVRLLPQVGHAVVADLRQEILVEGVRRFQVTHSEILNLTAGRVDFGLGCPRRKHHSGVALPRRPAPGGEIIS